jgi:hypothetical protein
VPGIEPEAALVLPADLRLTLPALAERAAAALEALGLHAQADGRVRPAPDERAIRYYTTLGLLDRPVAFRGRTALYGPKHVAQLVAIKRLQASGAPLAAVQRQLAAVPESVVYALAGVTTTTATGRDRPASSPPSPLEDGAKAAPESSASAACASSVVPGADRPAFWRAVPGPRDATGSDLPIPDAEGLAAAPTAWAPATTPNRAPRSAPASPSGEGAVVAAVSASCVATAEGAVTVAAHGRAFPVAAPASPGPRFAPEAAPAASPGPRFAPEAAPAASPGPRFAPEAAPASGAGFALACAPESTRPLGRTLASERAPGSSPESASAPAPSIASASTPALATASAAPPSPGAAVLHLVLPLSHGASLHVPVTRPPTATELAPVLAALAPVLPLLAAHLPIAPAPHATPPHPAVHPALAPETADDR